MAKQTLCPRIAPLLCWSSSVLGERELTFRAGQHSQLVSCICEEQVSDCPSSMGMQTLCPCIAPILCWSSSVLGKRELTFRAGQHSQLVSCICEEQVSDCPSSTGKQTLYPCRAPILCWSSSVLGKRELTSRAGQHSQLVSCICSQTVLLTWACKRFVLA